MSRLMTRDIRKDGETDFESLFVKASMRYLVSSMVHGQILLVGLGSGVWSEALSAFARRDDALSALDKDENRINRFRVVFPDFEYIHEDAFLHRPTTRYNTIVASHILEHVSDPVGLLSRFRRWLRPGGRVLLAVPNANSVHRHAERDFGQIQSVDELDESDVRCGHERVYTFDRLEADVIQSGLLVERYSGVGLQPVPDEMLPTLPLSYLKTCASIQTLGEHSSQLCAVLRT